MTPPNITPGPWRQASTAQADEYTTRILAGQGTRSFRVAETFAHPDADTFDEAEANARAIAAVPDVLDALAEVLPFLEADFEITQQKTLSSRTPTLIVVKSKRLEKVRAALLKAGYTF
jgi:hypothetical protein